MIENNCDNKEALSMYIARMDIEREPMNLSIWDEWEKNNVPAAQIKLNCDVVLLTTLWHGDTKWRR